VIRLTINIFKIPVLDYVHPECTVMQVELVRIVLFRVLRVHHWYNAKVALLHITFTIIQLVLRIARMDTWESLILASNAIPLAPHVQLHFKIVLPAQLAHTFISTDVWLNVLHWHIRIIKHVQLVLLLVLPVQALQILA
jgi:hypothetical protein